MVATQRLPFLAYPYLQAGIGHIAKQGDGFRCVSEPIRMVP
jgi:hypothetical protein